MSVQDNVYSSKDCVGLCCILYVSSCIPNTLQNTFDNILGFIFVYRYIKIEHILGQTHPNINSKIFIPMFLVGYYFES